MAKEKLEVSAVVWLGGKNFDSNKVKANNGSLSYHSVADWIERNKSYWSVCDGLLIHAVEITDTGKVSADLWLMNKVGKEPYDCTSDVKLLSTWFDKKYDLGKDVTYLDYDENLLVTHANKYMKKVEG